jgi:DNA-binding transcriptional regulator YiaG
MTQPRKRRKPIKPRTNLTMQQIADIKYLRWTLKLQVKEVADIVDTTMATVSRYAGAQWRRP